VRWCAPSDSFVSFGGAAGEPGERFRAPIRDNPAKNGNRLNGNDFR
jgi:hypothetical protein